MLEREVVQHPTVNEIGVARSLAGELVGAEELALDRPEIWRSWLSDLPHEVGQADRRERSRETGGCPSRKGERGVVRPASEMVLAAPAIQGEPGHVAVGQV